MTTKRDVGDIYARIRMPWARKGRTFRSPSYHRIDPENTLRTRCGMPIIGKLDAEWMRTTRPALAQVCKTCDYMVPR